MNLVESYQMYIQSLKAEKEDQMESCVQKHCDDDAKFYRIELNIIEIFDKMFEISLNKSKNNFSDLLENLKISYLSNFDKIPRNWQVELNKCEEFGDEEGVYIERLKINQANAMKTEFLRLYSEVQNNVQR